MTASNLTPYKILDVSKDIGYGKLRTVYRTKIHEHLQNKISPVDFRLICRAYETISDTDRRARYDNQNEWIFDLSIDKYTPQQLAAEPDLILELKKRLENATLTKINAQDLITGHTTLYCAARAGNVEAVKFLTEHGAEPDISQRTKSTALHAAAFYGHANVVRCLLESGADYRIINAMNGTGESEASNDDVRQTFAELKQNPYVRVAANELDWFRTNGLAQHQDTEYFVQHQTLLHCASKKGYFDMVRLLVEQHSANIDLVDLNRNSALHLAAYGGHKDIVNYLLNRGCDPTLKNRWGTTAEEEGIKHGRMIIDLFQNMRKRDMFEMVRNGVDWWFYYHFGNRSSDMIDSTGISLLYYACRYGHDSIAKWLLEHGANINIQMKGKPKSTPLHVAKYRGHFSIIELLLQYGADVNIKNDFGNTVFDEDIYKDVNELVVNKIKELLEQYKCNLKSNKLLDIYVYENDGDGKEPIAKLKLAIEAGYKDLLTALSNVTNDQYPYFSVARRALDFSKEGTTIISALVCARYASSKFIDTPIRLIRHKTLPPSYTSYQSIRQETKLNLVDFDKQFRNQGTLKSFLLKAKPRKTQCINIDSLMFTFSERSINNQIDFRVTTLFSPDFGTFGLPECICLFKIDLRRDILNLVELPTVSITNEPHARLYTLAAPTPYWFASDTRRTHLPMISGIHAFVRLVDVIPGKLTLPLDMFIAAALGKALKSRKDPVPCTCLTIREQDKTTFPLVAYHGTNINAIRPILLDGLVLPDTVVSNGIRVSPPSNHFAREDTHFNVPDFANAIFLSPSIHYSSHLVYAPIFSDGDQQLIPVLECSVKSGSYTPYPSTIKSYSKNPGDDITAIEWRVTDPANIEINAVLFITKTPSVTSAREERINAITPPSSSCTIS